MFLSSSVVVCHEAHKVVQSEVLSSDTALFPWNVECFKYQSAYLGNGPNTKVPIVQSLMKVLSIENEG